MPVTCPGCGRAYDQRRFGLGRLLQCACGAEVAPRVEPREAALRRPLRFAADAMLGRLARWLRLLGLDASFEPDIDDEELVRRAVAEDRIVLTRDRRLPDQWRISGVVLLDAESPMAQLRELEQRLGIAGDARPFSRCGRCNALLHRADGSEVGRDVPPAVLAAHADFRRCPRCRRVYWSGSHVDRALRALSGALPGLRSDHGRTSPSRL